MNTSTMRKKLKSIGQSVPDAPVGPDSVGLSKADRASVHHSAVAQLRSQRADRQFQQFYRVARLSEDFRDYRLVTWMMAVCFSFMSTILMIRTCIVNIPRLVHSPLVASVSILMAFGIAAVVTLVTSAMIRLAHDSYDKHRQIELPIQTKDRHVRMRNR